MSGVLLDFDTDKLRQNVADATGHDKSYIESVWRNEKYHLSELGQVTSEEFYEYFSHEIRLSWSYERFIEEWSVICDENTRGMKLFNELKQNGYKVYILSNLAEYHKLAVEYRFQDFWKISDANFLSYQMGMLKPDHKIYHSVCSQIEKLPEDCFFFDDSLENINAAKEVGISAYHFTSLEHNRVLQELKEKGIVEISN